MKLSSPCLLALSLVVATVGMAGIIYQGASQPRPAGAAIPALPPLLVAGSRGTLLTQPGAMVPVCREPAALMICGENGLVSPGAFQKVTLPALYVASRTPVLVLGYDAGDPVAARVRIAAGDQRGREGWVYPQWVKRS